MRPHCEQRLRKKPRHFRARAGAFAPLFWAALLTGCNKPAPPPPPPAPKLEEPPTVEQPPPPPPQPPPITIPYKKMDTGKMFSGIQLKTTFTAEIGTTATADRQDPASYELDLQLRVRVPKPHQSLEELEKLNPNLRRILPDLGKLLPSAKIAPIYEELYQRKVASLQNSLTHLDALLSRHNFFDIETILELESPLTGRKALLIQSDMDVDTDGSDGDRVATLEGVSTTFQPFTSFRWPKVTQKPNPFLAVWDKRLKDAEKELATPNLAPTRQKDLQDIRNNLKQQIADLKKFSYLVGSVDPFVVLPLPMVSRKEGQPAAKIGDYCVVIHGDKLIPAIVGDAGPSIKSGEASLRICKEINQRANLAARPESDLKVTYIVFPGTAESPRKAPSLVQWWLRCDELLGELGAYRGELLFLEDLTKPKMTPPPWDPNFMGPKLQFYGPPSPW
jgi:hypothetical protein